MQGLKRRIVYLTSFELIAIAVSSTGLALLSGRPATSAGAAAVGASAIAVAWNWAFNAVFERWEARQAKKGRSVWRRIAHAIGFEAGLVLMIVPLFAWVLDVSLWEAFVLNLGLMVFFLGYTFVFNMAFDAIFGLPASAAPKAAADIPK